MWQTAIGRRKCRNSGCVERVSTPSFLAEFLFDDRYYGGYFEVAVEFPAVEKERGSAADAGGLAFLLFGEHTGLVFVAGHFGVEAVHIQFQLLRVAVDQLAIKMRETGVYQVVHLPEFTLGLGGQRGFGGHLGLGM